MNGMRNDLGETEDHARIRSQKCSDGLLALLQQNHPDLAARIPRKVEIGDSSASLLRGQLAERDCQIVILKAQAKEQQALIRRQRAVIIKMREEDDAEYPRMSEVVELVCGFYKVTKSQMISGQRSSKLTLPRHVIYYLAREVTKMSLPEIGRKLGGRDHTTILHGIRRIERLLIDDQHLQDDLDVLRAKIDAHVLDRRVAAMGVAA